MPETEELGELVVVGVSVSVTLMLPENDGDSDGGGLFIETEDELEYVCEFDAVHVSERLTVASVDVDAEDDTDGAGDVDTDNDTDGDGDAVAVIVEEQTLFDAYAGAAVAMYKNELDGAPVVKFVPRTFRFVDENVPAIANELLSGRETIASPYSEPVLPAEDAHRTEPSFAESLAKKMSVEPALRSTKQPIARVAEL